MRAWASLKSSRMQGVEISYVLFEITAKLSMKSQLKSEISSENQSRTSISMAVYACLYHDRNHEI